MGFIEVLHWNPFLCREFPLRDLFLFSVQLVCFSARELADKLALLTRGSRWLGAYEYCVFCSLEGGGEKAR